MPSTRSRSSTETPEVAEEVKKSDELPTESAEKDPIERSDNENTNSTTDDLKDEEESNDNEVSETNGDNDNSSEVVEKVEKVENGSAKRKSETLISDFVEGEVIPDSTDITSKKVKVDDENGKSVADVVEAEVPEVETSA